MHDRSPPDDLLRRAEALLAERIASSEAGARLDIDALCREQPELKEALREVAAPWCWLEKALQSLSGRARDEALKGLARGDRNGKPGSLSFWASLLRRKDA